MATFGCTDWVSDFTEVTTAGRGLGSKFTLAETALVSKLTGYFQCDGHPVVGYICADNAGSCGNVLYVTQAFSTAGWGWHDMAFTSPPELEAGDYWLCEQIQEATVYLGWYWVESSGLTIYRGDGTYPNGVAVTTLQTTNPHMSIYATYDAVVPVPTVTDVSPATGTYAGGTSVTITGTDFTDATDVDFGTTAASSFTVNSATSISATTPAHAVGTVDVTVTTAAGTSATAGTDNDFEYIVPAPTISAAQSGSDIVVTWS